MATYYTATTSGPPGEDNPLWAEKLVLEGTDLVLPSRDLHLIADCIRTRVARARREGQREGAEAMRDRCVEFVREITDELDRLARQTATGSVPNAVIQDGLTLLLNVLHGVEGLLPAEQR
jgi:hypothetical protein